MIISWSCLPLAKKWNWLDVACSSAKPLNYKMAINHCQTFVCYIISTKTPLILRPRTCWNKLFWTPKCVVMIYQGNINIVLPRTQPFLRAIAKMTTKIYQCLEILQWCHNGRDSVSNHQPHDCLLSRLFRRRSKKTSKLRVTGLCAGNSPGTGEFPA